MLIRNLIVAVATVALAGFLIAPLAVADHGEGHNGETLELSKIEGIVDGEVVTVTLTSWLPGKTATIVTCFNYPVAGPTDCELSNYGQHTVDIDDDGTATYDYPVAVVPGRCDETTQCFIVAGDGIGAEANSAAQLVSFAAASEPEPEPTEEMVATPEPTEEVTPTPTPEPTEEVVAMPEPTEEVVAMPEPTEEVVAMPEPTEEVVAMPEPTEEMTAMPEPTEEMDDDGGSSVWVWLLPVIIVVAVVAAGLAVWRVRRRGATA
ncbi:hypothetical protein [Candidatus Poriferisocius sp.]|uniref:hypothetical protein n=1 Tax=Candidatus Poriferisocius sp. TaxID=3101276 RepID=UPI003B02B0E5